MVVQGLFDIDGNQAVAAKLAEFGIEPEDGRLILTREIGYHVPENVMADGMIIIHCKHSSNIGDNLIDIHDSMSIVAVSAPAGKT